MTTVDLSVLKNERKTLVFKISCNGKFQRETFLITFESNC